VSADSPTDGPSAEPSAPPADAAAPALGRTRSLTRLAAERLEQEINDAAAREKVEVNLGRSRSKDADAGVNERDAGRGQKVRVAGAALLAEGASRERSAEGDRAREAIRDAVGQQAGALAREAEGAIKSPESASAATDAVLPPHAEEAPVEPQPCVLPEPC
jgi:hypothetical protein